MARIRTNRRGGTFTIRVVCLFVAAAVASSCVEGSVEVPECTSDEDCPQDRKCADGVCKIGRCEHDFECPDRMACRDNECVEEPDARFCSSFADCRHNERCEGGLCVPQYSCPDDDCDVIDPPDTSPDSSAEIEDTAAEDTGPPPCTDDAECGPPLQVCVGGSCIDGCGRTGCNPDQTCNPSTGRCDDVGPTPCQADAACGPPSQICVGGYCIDGCLTTGCDAGETCNRSTGRCEDETPTPCQADATCGPPQQICEGNICIDGCLTTGCNAGEMCGTSTGRCEPETPTPCQADATCGPPQRICQNSVCVDGCLSTGCTSGQCNAQTGRCSAGQDLPLGATCETSSQCRSAWCAESTTVHGHTAVFCTHLCCDGSDCPSGMGCMYNLGVKFCVPASLFEGAATFSAPAGAPCFDANECRDAVCDTTHRECLRTCCTDADCGGLMCTIQQAGQSYKKICDFNLFTGYGQIGDPCPYGGEDCLSGLCADSPDGIPRCTDNCCTSFDCPGDHRCVQVGTPNPYGGGYYFLNLCQLKGTGSIAPGNPCNERVYPSECQSDLCVNGRCALPCCDDGDCSTGKRCLPDTFFHPDGGIQSNIATCQ